MGEGGRNEEVGRAGRGRRRAVEQSQECIVQAFQVDDVTCLEGPYSSVCFSFQPCWEFRGEPRGALQESMLPLSSLPLPADFHLLAHPSPTTPALIAFTLHGRLFATYKVNNKVLNVF
jgi:hypothetical protein